MTPAIWPYLSIARYTYRYRPATFTQVLIHEPTVTDRVSARSGGVGQQRCEALHPPEHGDVIDVDPMLGEELLDIAI